MTNWYYSDAAHTPHGPVDADDLARLHASGQLLPASLVWREGLGEWRPWSEVMTQVLNDTGQAGPLAGDPSPPADPYTMAEPPSPYAAPRAAAIGSADFHAGGEVVYAGFRKRVAAYLIDAFVLTAIASIVQVIVMIGAFGIGLGINAANPESMFSSPGAVMMLIGVYLVPLALQAAYYAMSHASTKQATLGKMAVGIKVADEAGQRITLGRGIGRFFAFLLSGITLGVGYLMVAFTERKRGLHDMVASTVVVDRWAYTAHPERQRRELDTVTVLILWVGGALMLGMIALMALAIILAAQAN